MPLSMAGAFCLTLGYAGISQAQPEVHPNMQPPHIQQPAIPQGGMHQPPMPHGGMQQPPMHPQGIERPNLPHAPGQFDQRPGMPGTNRPDFKGQFKPDGKPDFDRPDFKGHRPDMQKDFNKGPRFDRDRPQMEHRPGQKNHKDFKNEFKDRKEHKGKKNGYKHRGERNYN